MSHLQTCVLYTAYSLTHRHNILVYSSTILMSVRTASPPLNYDYSVITSDTDQSATLLLDAKNEYHKQLTSHLRQPIFNLMKTIYATAENICHQENTPENILMVFQDNLAQVPKWTKTRRTKEYEEFLKLSKCDWFNELIKFTYVTHVKILTIVNKPRPNVKLSISIPSGGSFYHGVCVNVARELWRSPFLFSKHVGKYEYQKNMRQIEQLIDNSVDTCIRSYIPMKAILQEYLDSDLSVPTHLSVPNKPTSASTIKQPGNESPIESNSEPMTDSKNTTTNSINPVNDKKKIPSARSSKLTVNNDLEEFINTPAIGTSKAQLITTNTTDTATDTANNTTTDESADKPNKADEKTTEDGLESVNFNSVDEIVDELDIIETGIDDKESVIAEDEAYENLAEVPLDTSSRSVTPAAGISPSSVTNTSNTTNTNQESAPNNTDDVSSTNGPQIEEFDIDSLPEISLTQIITNNPVDKPSSPVPTQYEKKESPDDTNTNDTNTNDTIPKNKQIPINDMNEPGLFPELKQPIPTKKQLVVEDLPTDDLDEVNLGSHAEELRTTKRVSLPGGQGHSTSRQKDFAFF